jgi:hypothetical protein
MVKILNHHKNLRSVTDKFLFLSIQSALINQHFLNKYENSTKKRDRKYVLLQLQGRRIVLYIS